MRLCNYVVKIEIPDNFPLREQDRALDAVDELDLPGVIERVVRAQLRATIWLKYATATVEE